jgi:GAF domain-containing protein
MNATPDSTFPDPEQLIADLQRQLADVRRTLDQRTVERDEAQRQLGQCTAERDEALAQEVATAEVLQVINSSPGDLAPVFEALLDKALTLCDGTFGIIRTYDGNSFHFGAMRRVPPEIAELMKQPRRPPFTGMVALERIVAGEPVVEIGDPRDLAGYRAGAPTIQAMVDRGGTRTGLWVALRKEAELLGFIWVYRQEIRPFTHRQIALLQNFASQAVIAIENARLLTETSEALEQQTATAEILQVINSSPGDLAPVFEAVVEKATRLCEATHGYLFTYDGERFHPGAEIGDSRYMEWTRQHGPFQPPANTALGRIRGGERLVHIADIRKDDAFEAVSAIRQVTEVSGARSVLTVALRRDEALLGGLGVYRQEVRPFSEKQIALL